MNPAELVEIGYVVRTHGVKGQLRILFDENIKELSVSEALFLLQKGKQIPFFIKEIEYINDQEAFILFEDIISKEDAQLFTKKPLWGKKDYLIEGEEEGDDAYTGYIVYDENNNAIGEVIAEYPMKEYALLEVLYNQKNVLIPFHEEIILLVDDTKKIIQLKLPEGILEL
ncbi:MAG: 16S rRNA processing protein RimM [Fimbriimonadaceae bacterium]|nr:16S rRNA processing protein RimM [Chitinophagales bacterium]